MKTIAAPTAETASITSASRFEPPGWINATTPASSASCGPSAKGKNASEARTAPSSECPSSPRLLDCDPNGVDPAHLPCSDSQRLPASSQDDRIRRHVLDNAPREDEIVPLRVGELSADHLHLRAIGHRGIALLDEKAAEHAPVIAFAFVDAALLRVHENAQRLLASQCLERRRLIPGCKQDLDELLCQRLGERRADRAVEDDDTSVRGERIGRKRLRVRLLDRPRDTDPARVRVLHDHARRPLELGRQQARRREIVEVVERERLSLELVDERKKMRASASLRVVGRRLVRVLSVREHELAVERRDE